MFGLSPTSFALIAAALLAIIILSIIALTRRPPE